MSDKVLLFGVYNYLLKYIDDDTKGFENLKDTVESMVNMYYELDDTYKGLEPRLYEFCENMLWSNCMNLIDKLFDYFQNVYGENLYTKLLENILNSLYKD